MDPMMQIFFILWMFVLPILAIVGVVLVPIFWFGIVPKIARTLTWKRFRKVSFHLIADDSGYVSLVPTTEELPEGIVNTKAGFRFLPRPRWIKGNPVPTDEDTGNLKDIMLRKFIWKDLGKPLWLGYAGKVAAFNPATLAMLQQRKHVEVDATGYVDEIKDYVKQLGQPHRKDLTKMLSELVTGLKFTALTVLDPTKIKEVLPKMYTPSQIIAVAVNREARGMKRAGKQWTPLILGGGIILGLILLIIVAMSMFMN